MYTFSPQRHFQFVDDLYRLFLFICIHRAREEILCFVEMEQIYTNGIMFYGSFCIFFHLTTWLCEDIDMPNYFKLPNTTPWYSYIRGHLVALWIKIKTVLNLFYSTTNAAVNFPSVYVTWTCAIVSLDCRPKRGTAESQAIHNLNFNRYCQICSLKNLNQFTFPPA